MSVEHVIKEVLITYARLRAIILYIVKIESLIKPLPLKHGHIVYKAINQESSMRNIIRTTLLFQILLMLPLLTKAELVQGEVYVGASVGVPMYDKLDKTDVGFKVYGGYMLYDYLGLDIGYVNLGNPKSGDVTLEASGANVAALAYLPINGNISLFAKAGSFIWDSDHSTKGNNNGNSISFGLGGDFSAADNILIQGEIERFKITDETIIMYSLGIKTTF